MGQTSSLVAYEHRLLRRLNDAPLFRTYQDAFRKATGLPLRLVAVDDQWELPGHLDNQSSFCEQLNLCDKACEACVATNRRLMEEAAKVSGPASCSCFAGLSSSAVPVKLGSSVFAFLKTGQVFERTPVEEDFERVAHTLRKEGVKDRDLGRLKKAYLETQTVHPERYQSMVTLLISFAEQLSNYADELSIIDEGREPEAIAKARQFIHSHLDEPLPLPLVARQAGLSESHFCRVFKDVSGLTLTDYVTRCRVGWAKRELLRPAARISDIAFKVGFQSLSQFNRSFARLVGLSPSAYRARAGEEAAS
jgi:AraC-like DNA-binding protein